MTMSATDVVSKRAHYSPPWADVSIIGIAGSSGSGKSTLSHAIVSKLNLPWVVILSMVTTILLKSRILWLKDAGFFLQNLRWGEFSKGVPKWIWLRLPGCCRLWCLSWSITWSQGRVRYFYHKLMTKPNSNSRKRAEIPIYSFAKHARERETTSIYSPHVLILEGIFALYDPRVLELLDMKVCASANYLITYSFSSL